jgi:hypothetical protein
VIKTERVEFFGYSDCVKLENEQVRVIFGHHCGGRILEYSLNGENILQLDPEQRGWTYQPGRPVIDPLGGRFDIGPEKVIPAHPTLWVGAWTIDIDSSGIVRMTSAKDKATGIQLIREFKLDEGSSHLSCKQTLLNISEQPHNWCHWSRTLTPGGGICIIPLTSPSRFPNQYVMYGPDPSINYLPHDPNVRIRNGFLEIIDTPKYPKLGMDSYAGWMAYLLKSHLLFVKRFSIYPERVYNEITGLTVSIWYYQDQLCEVEPIGPMERLAPGESASFIEDWWILPYKFPEQRDMLDLEEVAELVGRETCL